MARAAVDRLFERRLAALVNSRERGALAGGRRGLEREGLRVTPAGRVSAHPHPRALGSALCNPHITTDFSEALLELVSPTFTDNAALVNYLGDLHHFVARYLGEELLWAELLEARQADTDFISARYFDLLRTTGATAGWRSTCSASPRPCAPASCRIGMTRNCSRWAPQRCTCRTPLRCA